MPSLKYRATDLIQFALYLLLCGGLLGGHVYLVVREDRWLAEQQSAAVSVSADRIDPAHEGRLVHLVGRLECDPEGHTDPWSGTSAPGLALVRRTAIYLESSGSETSSSQWVTPCDGIAVGGTPEASEPTRSTVWLPRRLRVGAFTLNEALLIQLLQDLTGKSPDSFPVGGGLCDRALLCNQMRSAASKLPHVRASAAPQGWRMGSDGRLYNGVVIEKVDHDRAKCDKDPLIASVRPNDRDWLVEYRRVPIPDGPVTVFAVQKGHGVEPMRRDGDQPFAFVRLGSFEPDQLFSAARWENATSLTIGGLAGAVLSLLGILCLICGYLSELQAREERRLAAEKAASSQAPSPGPSG